MSDDKDKIEYKGPSMDYVVYPGGNFEDTQSYKSSITSGTYADKSYLEKLLNDLDEILQRFLTSLEVQLLNTALVVGPEDARLKEANTLEWPKALGAPKDRISYRYYKLLKTKNSAAASLIRSRFESAARDVGGTHALDMSTLVDSMQTESTLIREFNRVYVSKAIDAAEHRTLELFQDWANNAIFHAQSFEKLFKTGIQTKLPDEEITQLSTSEARNSQALFKVKLNTTNDKIAHSQDQLNKLFTQYAPVFYGNFLAPAMQFRTNAGNKFFPTQGQLGRELTRSTDSLNQNLHMLQGDQLKRNLVFDKKAQEINDLLQEQGTYQNYITQLADRGQSIPQGITGTMEDTEESEDEIEVLDAETTGVPVDNTAITSAHNALIGRDDDTAHPQYYLKAGDTLTGDLNLTDGAKVDGLVPHVHAHTGEDGSVKISGMDISGGTLQTSVIDTGETPTIPTDLQLISQIVRLTPPGVASIDLQIGWTGDTSLSYEVQIVAIAD